MYPQGRMDQIMLYGDEKSSSLFGQHFLRDIENFKRSDNPIERKKRIFYKTLLLDSNFLT
jgi:hypothetical protein